jgi:hypothetical protein
MNLSRKHGSFVIVAEVQSHVPADNGIFNSRAGWRFGIQFHLDRKYLGGIGRNAQFARKSRESSPSR